MPFIEVLKMYRGRKHPRNVTRNKTCFDIFLFFESLYKTFFESSGALFVEVKILHGNYDGKHSLAIWFCHENSAEIVPRCHNNRCNVTASCYRSLNALTEVEEPAGMGESLGTGAHCHKSILPPGVKYVPGPRVLRRILSNRS